MGQNNITDMDINGATVTHYLDEKHINRFEIRKHNCTGFGTTYQEALEDLQRKINNKFIKSTLSKSQEKNSENFPCNK